MGIDINKHEVEIDNLFKQNENDLCSIKELYRKLKELEKKISQIKYIDSNLADKLKKDYEKLKRIILDENIQAKLTNDINEINTQLDIIDKQVIYTNNPPKGLNPLIGNGSDETEKLNKIIDYCCNNNKKLIINEGTYLVNIEINKRNGRKNYSN